MVIICTYRRSGLAPKPNPLFLGTKPTYPLNLMKISWSEICTETHTQTTIKVEKTFTRSVNKLFCGFTGQQIPENGGECGSLWNDDKTYTWGYWRVFWRTQLSRIFSLLVCCRSAITSFITSFTCTHTNISKTVSKHGKLWDVVEKPVENTNILLLTAILQVTGQPGASAGSFQQTMTACCSLTHTRIK